MPERLFYGTDGFMAWFLEVLPFLERDRGSLKPDEQVDRLLWEFVTGKPMAYQQGAENLEPKTAAVWELKTIDVRIFGWFAARGTFIAVNGALRSSLKPWEKYAPYIEEVTDVRDGLDLDEPKFLPHGAVKDVL